jgi:malonate transporter
MVDMMSTILISLPLFLIIFGGWLMQRSKVMQGDWVHQANSFAYNVALPALVVVSLWNINFKDVVLLRLLEFSTLSLAAYLLLLFVGLSMARIGNDMKATIFLTAGTGNALYLGAGLIQVGFGADHLSAGMLVASIYFIVPFVLSILAIRYWHTKNHSFMDELTEFVKNPLVISVVVGVVLSFISVVKYPLIGTAKQALGMLGATSSPVALFALGGFLYGKMLKNDIGKIMLITALKMGAFPAIVFALYWAFYGQGNVEIPVLLASMPAAVTTFVIAERFKLNTTLVGSAIVFSTIMSFFVSPIILMLFK